MPLSRDEINAALLHGARINPSRPETFPDIGERFTPGTPVPGSRWTAEQLATIRAERDRLTALRFPWALAAAARLADPATVPTTLVEMTDGGALECPVLARTRDRRRVLIVSPRGDRLWTDA